LADGDAKEREKRRLAKLGQAYKQVLKTPQGRTVFADMVWYCRLFETTHVSSDPAASSMLEGQRRVLLRWIEMSKLTHDKIEEIVASAFVEE
jgi:hypothetical protein